MSKTVQWGIDKIKDRGIVKMMGLLINMIQDHDVSEYQVIGGEERTLLSIHNELKAIHNKGVYTQSEKKFLNGVRDLVLGYQQIDKKLNKTSLAFLLNSKGQIITH